MAQVAVLVMPGAIMLVAVSWERGAWFVIKAAVAFATAAYAHRLVRRVTAARQGNPHPSLGLLRD